MAAVRSAWNVLEQRFLNNLARENVYKGFLEVDSSVIQEFDGDFAAFFQSERLAEIDWSNYFHLVVGIVRNQGDDYRSINSFIYSNPVTLSGIVGIVYRFDGDPPPGL